MKKGNRRNFAAAAGMMMSLLAALPAAAEIRQLNLVADPSLTAPEAGIPFIPDFQADEEVRLQWKGIPELGDPTKPIVLQAYLYSEGEEFSDRLRVGGKGIRRTYVDLISPDHQKAAIRLELYPFYRLKEAEGLCFDGETAHWNPVAYADRYEILIRYQENNGREKIIRKTVRSTEVNLLSYAGKEEFDFALRALPSSDRTDQYCNLAAGSFVSWNGMGTEMYEEESVWEQVGQYQAVEDRETGAYIHGSGYMSRGSEGPGAQADGVWKRIGYQWQFLEEGKPLQSCWKQILGSWYYFGEDGMMATGWLHIDGKWYYMEPEVGRSQGIMTKGKRVIDGQEWEFEENGALKK